MGTKVSNLSRIAVFDAESSERIDTLAIADSSRAGAGAEGVVTWEPEDGNGLRISCDGFFSKSYSERAPKTIRLLKNSPYCCSETASAFPGESFRVYYSSSSEAELLLVKKYGTPKRILLTTCSARNGQVDDADPVELGVKDWPFVEINTPDVESGLWSLQIRDQAGETADAPFIVKSRKKQRIMVVSSFLTWNCYNHWGGRSRYKNFLGAGQPEQEKVISFWRRLVSNLLHRIVREPAREWIKNRFFPSKKQKWLYLPISWVRPWVKDIGLDVSPDASCLNHMAALESKILHWLESENIDFQCVADKDLHDDACSFDGVRAVILMGHSEYWSSRMFRKICEENKKGVWVINASGNSIYREVRIGSESCQLENMVFGLSGNDERKLLGVRFNERSFGTAAPYQVKNEKHWAFKDLKIKAGDEFGRSCLISNSGASGVGKLYNPATPSTPGNLLQGEGASGFEVDSCNGSKGFVLIAKGTQKGGACMVVKEPKDGAGGVFSASSINFGGALLTDKVCSKIMLNIIGRSCKEADL